MNFLFIYTTITRLSTPFLRAHLVWRSFKGKEDKVRIGERFGIASKSRHAGKLIWLHAASIGEAMSLLKLVEALHARLPNAQMLMTTGTVTSARLLAEKLPSYVMHQFVPLDTPQWVGRFLDYWNPDLGIFTESELWPNMILESKRRGVKLALINARMSERSFIRWQMMPEMIRELLAPFALITAQSEEAAEHYAALGGKNILRLGNLKHDAETLPVDENILQQFKSHIGARPCIVAASLHPGEEEIIVAAHRKLKVQFPNLLTIIIPRHPNRGALMAEEAKAAALRIAMRSRHEALNNDVDIYIADTIGELGLWYRLATIVIMGGSFITHGGQNPLEPARLAAPIITGPHMFHFQEIMDDMRAHQAIIALMQSDLVPLVEALQNLLESNETRLALGARAKQGLEQKPKVAACVADEIVKLLSQEAS